MMNFSIVIPVYNESESLNKFLVDLKSYLDIKEFDGEIIIVDDGSTDNSYEIAQAAGVKLISHSANRGYGASIKTGIRNAEHDLICIIDADATYKIEELEKLLAYVDRCDMVVGARDKRRIPIIRRPAKWVLAKLANYLSETKIPDINSGFRIFRKSLVEKYFNILPSGFSFTTTITLAYLCDRYEIQYVPISYLDRKGQSKIRPIKDTLNFMQLIVRTILYFNPMKVLLPLSLLFFVAGISILLYSYFFTPRVMDISSIVLIVASLQVAVMALLADLIVKRTRQ